MKTDLTFNFSGVPSASAAAATSTSTQNTSNMLSVPQSNNTNVENGNYSTPMISVSDRKRKDTRTVDAPSVAKRSRGRASSTSRKVPVLGIVYLSPCLII